ncbi:MAG: hypothetical protein QOK29_977 [Rhodospirillaceae bacterium]|jgi:hypothetical protein|nr:hypothetical protein [Rhodospirillaceae bacterium]
MRKIVTIDSPLIELQRRLASLPPPVIIYNKSHSGSRLLARVLMEQGLFLGACRNESEDALPLLPVVEACVTRFYPDYGTLWRDRGCGSARLAALIVEGFERHLADYDPAAGRPWGWKLCETLYAMPVFARLFPRARVVHLLRDGRDVAWCNHVAPELPFWRKVYFNTDGIRRWRGHALTNAAYERRPHLYNALHWKNSVEVGRAYGAMLADQYAELRYEDLCGNFAGTMTSLLEWLGITPDPAALDRWVKLVHRGSIGKHLQKPRRAQHAVLQLIEPTLASFGYLAVQPLVPDRARFLPGWLRRQ